MVVLHMLKELQFQEAVVVHVKDDIDALDFVNIFEMHRSNFKIRVRTFAISIKQEKVVFMDF